jgi:hypothetical protein
VPSLLIPIVFLIGCFGWIVHPVDGLVFTAGFKFCSLVSAFSRGSWLCSFLFYFNGEFDPGSG